MTRARYIGKIILRTEAELKEMFTERFLFLTGRFISLGIATCSNLKLNKGLMVFGEEKIRNVM